MFIEPSVEEISFEKLKSILRYFWKEIGKNELFKEKEISYLRKSIENIVSFLQNNNTIKFFTMNLGKEKILCFFTFDGFDKNFEENVKILRKYLYERGSISSYLKNFNKEYQSIDDSNTLNIMVVLTIPPTMTI